jgi:S-methylmethionine-dependent homocysteine/selenocysteine methylase
VVAAGIILTGYRGAMEMGESARRAKAADEASAWLGARLGAGAPICLDGATGTELERRAENLATAGVDLILIETMNSVAEFETDVEGWISQGARLVGGCCGTTPDHIRAIAHALAGK